ncbi:MAG: aldehyde dehydrogenase family protein, partial [Pseudomonadota bacterium]
MEPIRFDTLMHSEKGRGHMYQDSTMKAQQTALAAQLGLCQAAYTSDPAPDHAARIDRLNRLRAAVVDHKDRLIAAVNSDFNGRSPSETMLIEIIPILESIHYNRKHLRTWMRPSRRHVPLGLLGSTAAVHYQPLGVIGIISPWNFPLFLALSPLAGAFAAGNRAMIKMSELAPKTAEAVQAMLGDYFTSQEVTVVTGGPDVAAAFSALPFDHLLFTGSTQVGRKVMAAAAQNLTPVTLELGGKSPCIIHEDFDFDIAAGRITFGKGLNAGQVCVAPDYVLVPSSKVNEFIQSIQRAFAKL